jgi:MFS family permease
MAVNGILANTMLQLEAPDRLRGRVMGFYSFVVLGMAPFGAFQAGWVSEHYGVRVSFALGGLACVLMAAAVGYAVRKRTPGKTAESEGEGAEAANLHNRMAAP